MSPGHKGTVLRVKWQTQQKSPEASLLESAKGLHLASPPRFSGPSQFLAQTVACLTQRLGYELTSQLMSVEKLKAESHS